MKRKLLEIKNLSVSFFSGGSSAEEVKAVCGLSFDVSEGEILGIVGESGSGKTVTAYSILGLVPDPPGKTLSGEIIFKGSDLRKLPFDEMRKIRGSEISMIFQEPSSALNPVMTIKSQLAETFAAHTDYNKETILSKSVEILKRCGIADAEKRINEYPGSLSGGMQQRVMIAMALSCNPSLLIADEPTTSLDVTVQAQILELIQNLKDENKISSVIMITHNMGIIAEMCDRVIVMYNGRILESAGVKDVFQNPRHPYTQALLDSVPVLGKTGNKELRALPSDDSAKSEYGTGCVFRGRCGRRMDICGGLEPGLKEISNGHFARCYLNE